MSWAHSFISSSIGRKVTMSLSGLFLITFLVVHLSINLLTLVDKHLFNEAAHFMSSNIVIQVMQFVLAAGFILHIIMGIRLTLKNRVSRPVKYVKGHGGVSSTWASRNMILTGILVLLFLLLHIKDFFIEVKTGNYAGFDNDYDMVVSLFQSPLYTGIYVVAFVLLAIHLYHGFQSAFQSLGANHSKYTPIIKFISTAFCVIVGAGFSAIALVHFINSLS